MQKCFYAFLIPSAFLMGLYPFFIPVLLWKKGFDLSQISFFISISGFSFCVALYFIERLYKKAPLIYVMSLSLIIEFILISTAFFQSFHFFFPLFAISFGAYSCTFWVIKRTLFFEMLSDQNTGMKFGNFQIVLFIALKIGILLSGFLMDTFGLKEIYLLSIITSTLSMIYFSQHFKTFQLPKYLIQSPSINIKDILNFKDHLYSKLIFIIDGLFLFLESYFWLISLFLIAHESFLTLGLIVAGLSLFFALLFVFIKSKIDQFASQKIYVISAIGYCLSWYLRSIFNEKIPLIFLFILLLSISFLTAFFRLNFNKRFFENAKKTSQHHYLIVKSYYSQFFIFIVFLLLGIWLKNMQNTNQFFEPLYFLASIIAVLYMLYQPSRADQTHESTKLKTTFNQNRHQNT